MIVVGRRTKRSSKPALLALPKGCPTAWSAPRSKRRGSQRLQPGCAAPPGGCLSDYRLRNQRQKGVEHELSKWGKLGPAQRPKATELRAEL